MPVFSGLNRFQQSFSHWFVRFIRTRYGPLLRFAISHRYMVAVIAISTFTVTLGYIKGGHMGFEPFPRVESDYAYAYASMPYGTPIEKSEEVAKRMLDAAWKVVEDSGHPELCEGIFADVGKDGSHTVELRAFLADAEIRKELNISTAEFVKRWREKLGTITGADGMIAIAVNTGSR